MIQILFVCMGNICRSPAAEGIMQALLRKRNLDQDILVDSCATHTYHIGCKPDARMLAHAARRGYELTSVARAFEPSEDFARFDYIIVMDDDNYTNILYWDSKGQYTAKIQRMTDYCRKHKVNAVPDPYYGGTAGFENVLDILEDACEGLLETILVAHGRQLNKGMQ